MKNHKTYSQQEIQKNIETLTKDLDSKVLFRKSINTDINNIKKQIKTWQELDKNQYKLFEQ